MIVRYAVLVDYDRPLSPAQQRMLAADPDPVCPITWQPGPGPVTGILTVTGSDAIRAGAAAAGWCYIALGRTVTVRVAAVVPADAAWPPPWTSTSNPTAATRAAVPAHAAARSGDGGR